LEQGRCYLISFWVSHVTSNWHSGWVIGMVQVSNQVCWRCFRYIPWLQIMLFKATCNMNFELHIEIGRLSVYSILCFTPTKFWKVLCLTCLQPTHLKPRMHVEFLDPTSQVPCALGLVCGVVGRTFIMPQLHLGLL
jgi:hypothetical protein